MKVNYSHLKNFFTSDPGIDEVSQKLFQLGHENHFYENILDVEITPNRGDVLSVRGLANDLRAFFDCKQKPIDIFTKDISDMNFSFKNNFPQGCPRISFLKIQIERPSSKYMDYIEDFFTSTEQTKINFFTDISNYLMYEIGQPTHCYDLKKLKGELTYEKLIKCESFENLHQKKLNLSPGDCVFKLNNNVINLAGIIGGNTTSCSKSTDSAIIECAYFSPENIIGRSVKYDLKSDAAFRFERGVDPSIQTFALRRFIQIVKDHTKILDIKIFQEKFQNFQQDEINFNYKNIQKILGHKISKKNMIGIMQNLGFKIKQNAQIEKIIVPFHRSDIDSENDIAEEIARVYGYDNIPRKKTLIKLKKARGKKKCKELFIKDKLIKNGFFEVINFPFCENVFENQIRLENPLDSKKSFMRSSNIDSLLSNLIFNEKRQKDKIKIFEISNIYTNSKSGYDEKRLLSLLVSGRKNHNYLEFSKMLNKHYLEDILTDLFEKDSLQDIEITEIDRLKLKSKSKSKIFVVEINLDDAQLKIEPTDDYLGLKTKFIEYKKISEFPSIKRDLSFSIESTKVLMDLENIIFKFNNPMLKDCFIFDFYSPGDNLVTKIGYSFLFQSQDKTLTDNEVDCIMDDIVKSTLKLKGVKVPGYKLN